MGNVCDRQGGRETETGRQAGRQKGRREERQVGKQGDKQAWRFAGILCVQRQLFTRPVAWLVAASLAALNGTSPPPPLLRSPRKPPQALAHLPVQVGPPW